MATTVWPAVPKHLHPARLPKRMHKNSCAGAKQEKLLYERLAKLRIPSPAQQGTKSPVCTKRLLQGGRPMQLRNQRPGKQARPHPSEADRTEEACGPAGLSKEEQSELAKAAKANEDGGNGGGK